MTPNSSSEAAVDATDGALYGLTAAAMSAAALAALRPSNDRELAMLTSPALLGTRLDLDIPSSSPPGSASCIVRAAARQRDSKNEDPEDAALAGLKDSEPEPMEVALPGCHVELELLEPGRAELGRLEAFQAISSR
mmetsp:Transcript_17910/g.31417  ORF Transcript_17910/g.31417 Transcript_17910/m.31417 type:complete len:136 (-) Transcript_17910:433-840(-)